MVENEKFHVHRLILSMNSPVFKAMFKSAFKEVTNDEISLPEKKANEVLDFLKQLYIQERQEITSKCKLWRFWKPWGYICSSRPGCSKSQLKKANSRLNDYGYFNFSYAELVFLLLMSVVKLKQLRWSKNRTENLVERCKTVIKFHSNPGLGWSYFE